MSPSDRLQQDLDFVSNAVRRGEDDHGYPALYFLWAGLIAVGFALPDFVPKYALVYWLTAGLGGGLFSWWYGGRRARAEGMRDRRLGRRYALHWVLSGIGIGLVVVMGTTGALAPAQMAGLLLVTTGMAYALAGVHLNPPMLPAGFIMLLAAAAMMILKLPYVWTATGLAVAVALVIAGIGAARAG